MKHDPRLAAWKEQDRAEKDAKRLAREEAVRKQAEDEVRAKQLAAEAEEKLRIDEQSRREAEKKEKETRKRDLRLARKEFRTVLEQRLGAAAFATVSTAVEDYLKTTEMVLERVRDAIADLPYINDVTQLREMMTTGARPLRTATASTTSNGESMITATTTKQQQKPPVTPTVVSTAAAVPVPQAKEAARPWTEEESRLLIKAVKTYPGGTKNRWPTVAEYVALHSQQPERTTAEIMQHIKDTATGMDEWLDGHSAYLYDTCPLSASQVKHFTDDTNGVDASSDRVQ